MDPTAARLRDENQRSDHAWILVQLCEPLIDKVNGAIQIDRHAEDGELDDGEQ